MLSYPFENIKSFTNLLYEAARDDSVVSIKMTLYRLAVRSQIVDALVEAAENGKEVVVLVELRARFDEESNIEYSRKLENSKEKRCCNRNRTANRKFYGFSKL